MKVIMLVTLLIGACAALPAISEESLQTEMTNKVLDERAGQNDSQSSAGGEKPFLDQLFDGVADAVSGGALSPLADSALKPLVSAVGSSVLEQIFSAANDIINEWKRSKHHNLEAHPVFIPDRGAFILVSADWIIPEQLPESIDEEQETPTAESTTEYSETANFQDDLPDVIENVTNEDGLRVKPMDYDVTLEPINYENNASISNASVYEKDNESSASIVTKLSDNSNAATLLSVNDVVVKNITEELALEQADFEINNEIKRRSIPVKEVIEPIKGEEENLQQNNNLNHRKGRFQNIADYKHWGHHFGRAARTLNEKDVAMPEMIQLKNVYLVPVPGEVDWTSGEEEFGAIQEALKAVMATKKVSERNQMRVEEFLANKLKKLADNLTSS